MTTVRKVLMSSKTKAREGRNVKDINALKEELDALKQQKPEAEWSCSELINAGLSCNEYSDYLPANDYFTRAFEKLKQEVLTVDEMQVFTAICYYGLANCARELGKNEEAINHFKLAREECKGSLQISDIAYEVERNLGIAYLKEKLFNNAAECFSFSIDIAKQVNANLLPAVTSYCGLALVLGGYHVQGFELLQKARKLFPESDRESSMDWASHRFHMALACQAIGDHQNAIIEFEEALRLRIKMIDRDKIGSVYFHSRVGDVHFALGKSFLALKDYDAAKQWLSEAFINFQVLGNINKIEEINQLQGQVVRESYLQYVPSTKTAMRMFGVLAVGAAVACRWLSADPLAEMGHSRTFGQ